MAAETLSTTASRTDVTPEGVEVSLPADPAAKLPAVPASSSADPSGTPSAAAHKGSATSIVVHLEQEANSEDEDESATSAPLGAGTDALPEPKLASPAPKLRANGGAAPSSSDKLKRTESSASKDSRSAAFLDAPPETRLMRKVTSRSSSGNPFLGRMLFSAGMGSSFRAPLSGKNLTELAATISGPEARSTPASIETIRQTYLASDSDTLLDPADLHYISPLGAGAFGVVWKVCAFLCACAPASCAE